jgi:hypothetical protein
MYGNYNIRQLFPWISIFFRTVWSTCKPTWSNEISAKQSTNSTNRKKIVNYKQN